MFHQIFGELKEIFSNSGKTSGRMQKKKIKENVGKFETNFEKLKMKFIRFLCFC